MLKNLWICLILQKNLCRKYRFFALFRRVVQELQRTSIIATLATPWSLICSTGLSNLPEKCIASELFADFSRHV